MNLGTLFFMGMMLAAYFLGAYTMQRAFVIAALDHCGQDVVLRIYATAFRCTHEVARKRLAAYIDIWIRRYHG